MPAVKGRSFSSFKQRAIAVAVASCYLGTAVANPTGGTVASGSATISSSGNTLTVTNTPGAIINWQQFSIQKDEVTRFIQQNASSAVLNRVTTQNPSVILGTLTSNGRVFLINPSGIAFGVGSVINVAGLAASTLNISDSDFLSGRLRFVGTGTEGAVTNAGTITTPEGGHVYLIAPNVQNQAGGVITSPKGEVVIAAGQTVELVNAMTPDIRVEYTAPSNEAVNAGQIVAASGRIGVFGTLVRNSGLVSASRAEVGDGGQIVFRAVKDVTLDAASRLEANGNQGGSVTVQADTGTLLAQGTVEAKGDAGQGGQVQMLGKQVALDGTASVDASGSNGGGRVLIGGD
ncbi:MAG TPA: filamentous hemagglutinin N-terminal domain-containing protein, partial [Burkholderiales bacterium]|nr:filamentous hemagglutinin N-terminal domain-containing protein [Burkholderiales bacterium]